MKKISATKSIIRSPKVFFSTELIPRQQKTEIIQGKPVFKDAWVSKLMKRSVLSVRGRDAFDLLQNTSTNDMNLFSKESERAALYTSFLTVKGKLMMDAFVVKPKLAAQTAEDTEFWVDLAEEDLDPLVKHLRRYAMRKNIKIEDISTVIKSFQVQTMVGVPKTQPEGHFFKELQNEVEMFESEEFPGSLETDVAAFVDPRTASNGVRILCSEHSFQPDDGVTILEDNQVEYNISRMLLGLPEGSAELKNRNPLQMNLQFLHGVSFEKGCYIGQELTQRTHFTGVIRKLVLPFALLKDKDEKISIDLDYFSPYNNVDRKFDMPLSGEEIVDQSGKKLGKVIASQNNVGLVLADIPKLNKNGANHSYTLGGYRALLWQPLWLDMQLSREGGFEDEEPEVEGEFGKRDD